MNLKREKVIHTVKILLLGVVVLYIWFQRILSSITTPDLIV